MYKICQFKYNLTTNNQLYQQKISVRVKNNNKKIITTHSANFVSTENSKEFLFIIIFEIEAIILLIKV